MAPDTNDISLLRGIVRIDRHSGGLKTGYVDAGECGKFDMPAMEINEIKLFTARDGSGGLAKKTATRKVPKFEIEGYELNTFNLALQLFGLTGVLTQAASTATDLVLTPSVALGRSYFTAHRAISAVVVEQGATTLVANTDYTVDLANGRIYFLPSGDATEGEAATVSYSYGVVSLETVSLGNVNAIDLSINYVGDSATGAKYNADIWHAQIVPSQGLSLIGDPNANEYGKWSISGEVLTDSAGLFGGSAQYPFGRLVKIGQVTS